MKVLIVDDMPVKASTLAECVRQCDATAEIFHAATAKDAFAVLSGQPIALVLLDILLPLQLGDAPSEGGSTWFVREVQRKLTALSLPLVVGITQFPDSLAKVSEMFKDYLWSVVLYADQDARWRTQISHAVRYAGAKATRGSLSSASGNCDVGIVTAIRIPEFQEVVDALGGGERFVISENNESWLRCEIVADNGQSVSVVAACADDMGMCAMSALATRLCICCRPRNLILVGIMGGNGERVSMSDLIVVEETWDCRAGKISEDGFAADVKSQRANFALLNCSRRVIDEDLLMSLWKSWKDVKPNQIPRLHVGAVACSPAVIADDKEFKELERQKRKVLGVEMEAYGCYDAAHRLGDFAPRALSIKSVCDLGDKAKANHFQRYCAFLSASAAIRVIKAGCFTST